jgi:hypothetical protein
VSEHEAELRRRVSNGDDIYDTMVWFLAAIDAQGYVDRGCRGPEPNLSWFEREFLRDNTDRYHEERMRRKTFLELLNDIATALPLHPERARIDMSDVADKELANMIGDDDLTDSAVEELVTRANRKCMTVAEYIRDVARRESDPL